MTVGLVLAGGLGRRMGGALPKPLALLAGRPLLSHVLDRLTPQVDRVFLSANERDAFAEFGLEIVPDRRPDRPGPLEGLASLRARLAGSEPILTVPADTPFLPRDLERRLAAELPTAGVAVAAFGRRWQSVCALWSAEAAAKLEWEPGPVPGRSLPLREVIGRLHHAAVDFSPDADAPNGDPFFNVNTPADLSQAGNHIRSGF